MRNISIEPAEAPATLRALRREARRLLQRIPLQLLIVTLPVLEKAASVCDDEAKNTRLRVVGADGQRRKVSVS